MSTTHPVIAVELEQGSELRQEEVEASIAEVRAGELKAEILSLFGAGSPVLETEVESDEDESWVLLGVDAEGRRKRLADDQPIRLAEYRSFRVTPETVVGRRAGDRPW